MRCGSVSGGGNEWYAEFADKREGPFPTNSAAWRAADRMASDHVSPAESRNDYGFFASIDRPQILGTKKPKSKQQQKQSANRRGQILNELIARQRADGKDERKNSISPSQIKPKFRELREAQMRILVTGGAGYLGSILVPELLADGHRVDVLDNFMYRQTSLNDLCIDDRFSVTVGDARDKTVVAPLLAKADVLIPLAAIVGMPACEADKSAAIGTNTLAIGSAVGMMSREQRIVVPITNSGYGIGQPGKECTEETPLKPISHYGRTKVQAEMIVLDRGNAVSLRLATVFGMSPRMRLDLLVNDFVNRALTDRAIVLFEENFRRNFIHVRDVAGAFLHAIDNFAVMKDLPYNVGLSDENLSKLQLCRAIKKYIDFEILCAEHGTDPDKRDYIVSNARIEATGWRPQFSLDDGIKELIKGLPMIRNREHRNA